MTLYHCLLATNLSFLLYLVLTYVRINNLNEAQCDYVTLKRIEMSVPVRTLPVHGLGYAVNVLLTTERAVNYPDVSSLRMLRERTTAR